MKTRAQQRSNALEADRAADGDKPDAESLGRPPIRSLRKQAVNDRKETKTTPKNSKSLNESVTRREMRFNKSELETPQDEEEADPARTPERKAEDNSSYSSSDKSGNESDGEEEIIIEKRSYRSPAILPASSKGPRKDYSFNHPSHGEKETDPARMQQSKGLRRDYSLTKPSSFDDEKELHLPRLRQRKDAEKSQNSKSSNAFSYGKPKYEDLSIQDEKKHQLKFRSTASRDGNQRLITLKNDSFMFSEDEIERKPMQAPAAVKIGDLEKVESSYIYTIICVLLAGALLFSLRHLFLEKPSLQKEAEQLQVLQYFHDGFRKLPILFPSQSPQLWHRSQRMLEVHLGRAEENKGPAIILLTAAKDARKMLYCVGNQLAKAYASSRNSNYTVLSGMDISGSSEEVKMYIDGRLNEGFQTNRAAVLHQIELLPPASLLILYKYCDHENAAYQNVALVLTVLLNNSTLTPDIQLGELEEAVYDFLKETFVGSGSGTSHNVMDGDKLSGVWSRIAHVVLPVLPEKHIVKVCEEPKTNL